MQLNLLMKSRPKTVPVLRPRLQVTVGFEVVLGPGKADLLEQIRETGSIAKAAARMEMSYMRAWTLVRTMNTCFREPLVVTARGGKAQGGSHLTETGRRALELYRQMEQRARRAAEPVWTSLRQLLRT